ncbi:exo-alpha-sialidase [Shewanella dokdonensis]|uniref:Exo-alpha-sialidase n=1 Tax=Shewanella dokdonensis TaxID=712036 RepID=A0ABX8DGF6_9GAMM|nr:exo-alpha-sialidase [Shewanella dokdonensis]MCL1075028.1 exo-alpha-sialidase [Shewanella dokdonensis]QVK23450.1 exo-alpha-sialidase [Shewanella dokdonensis]
MKLISCKNIWCAAEHNAFGDLCQFQGKLYSVFREAAQHISPDGMLRLLCSSDGGEHWSSVACFKSSTADLRDGKLMVVGDYLYVYGAAVSHDKSPLQSVIWSSADGLHWSEAGNIGDPKYWLWRITVTPAALLAVGYRAGADGDTRLYRSALPEAGQIPVFSPWVVPFQADGYVNESSLLVVNQRAVCLLRRDPVWDDQQTALLGISEHYPFKDWSWHSLDKRIGGPVMLVDGERLLAVVRLYEDRVRTSVVEIDTKTMTIKECLEMPSGGDTSYAGVVQQGRQLLISYYSSHEQHTAIYFAKVALD